MRQVTFEFLRSHIGRQGNSHSNVVEFEVSYSSDIRTDKIICVLRRCLFIDVPAKEIADILI